MIKFLFLFLVSISAHAGTFDAIIKALPECTPAVSSNSTSPLIAKSPLTTRIIGKEKGQCKLVKMMKEKLMETCYLSLKEYQNIKNSKALAKALAKPGVCTKTQMSL